MMSDDEFEAFLAELERDYQRTLRRIDRQMALLGVLVVVVQVAGGAAIGWALGGALVGLVTGLGALGFWAIGTVIGTLLGERAGRPSTPWCDLLLAALLALQVAAIFRLDHLRRAALVLLARWGAG